MSYDVYIEETGFDTNYTWNMGYAINAGGVDMYRRGIDPERVTNDDGDFVLQGATVSAAIEPLKRCIAHIHVNEEKLREREPDNGWGSVDRVAWWLETILRACEEAVEMGHPDARVVVT